MTTPPTSDPHAFVTEAWARQIAAVDHPGSPWRTGVLATAGPQGPNARTVVLRAVGASPPSLTFHTDRRTPKMAELDADPSLCWVVWDPSTRLQLRAWARAGIDVSPPGREAVWSALHPGQRKAYLTAQAPGLSMPRPEPDRLDGDSGPMHLAILRCAVDRVDVLWLARGDHVRARGEWVDGDWAATWVTP